MACTPEKSNLSFSKLPEPPDLQSHSEALAIGSGVVDVSNINVKRGKGSQAGGEGVHSNSLFATKTIINRPPLIEI
jgi:hypothetical protein